MPQSSQAKGTIIVIGHRNPDTDSVCSAIAYAALKNSAGGESYVACRAGELNRETAFVLQKFGVTEPSLCLDVRAQVQDLDIRPVEGVDRQTTMRRAWEIMRDQDVTTLPIIDRKHRLLGLITLQDIAMANLDSLDAQVLARARTPLSNLLQTLRGELLVGDPATCLQRGKVVIGAGSPEVLETMVQPGDTVLLANRYDTQLCAIEMNAACLVVCLAPVVAKTILKLAQEHQCATISTPFDTYTTACLINQSIPIGHYMQHKLQTFQLSSAVEEVREVMGRVRYNYFPVLDEEGAYQGLISKRNLLNARRKQLVLVDHNEKTQCVEGFEEAEVLAIIDHHRIGNLETGGPVYFRNQPVGSTATILYQMYQEEGVALKPEIAGILCCAILSDTLALRSPTSTKSDELAAAALASIAGVELMPLAAELFAAGEDLTGKTPEELFYQDYKAFAHGDLRLGVGQGSYTSAASCDKVQQLLTSYLPQALQEQGVDMVFYMITSVPDQSSRILCAGKGARKLLEAAFGTAADAAGVVTLPGVVSRKKQLIPALLQALQQES